MSQGPQSCLLAHSDSAWHEGDTQPCCSLPSVTPRRALLLPQPQFPHLLSRAGGWVRGGRGSGPGCSGCQPIGPEGCLRVQEHCPHFQEPSGPALPEPGHPGQQPAQTSSNQTRSVRAAMHRPLQTRPLPATWALVPSPERQGRKAMGSLLVHWATRPP